MVVLGPIGPWTAEATCSKGQVVRQGGVGGGGGGGEGRGLAPVYGGPVKLFLVHVPCMTNEEGWWLYCPIG